LYDLNKKASNTLESFFKASHDLVIKFDNPIPVLNEVIRKEASPLLSA
jgi:hypothetical protein